MIGIKSSEDIQEICKALVNFHSEVGRIEKDGTNPHLKNRYATIDQIIEEIRPILAQNGLFILQLPTNSESGGIQMTTRIYHVSGQWMESPILTLKPDRTTAQGIGSVVTYARRYSLTSFLSLNTGEDDDGNAASGQRGAKINANRGKEQLSLEKAKKLTLEAAIKKGLSKDGAVKLLKAYAADPKKGVTVEECRQAVKDIKTQSLQDLKLATVAESSNEKEEEKSENQAG